MFMLVNKRSYISCANGVEIWVLAEKKKFIFVNRVIKSHSRPIKAKWRKIIIGVKFSFKQTFKHTLEHVFYVLKKNIQYSHMWGRLID